MTGIKFQCPSCGQTLETDTDMAGSQVECPVCKKTALVPASAGSSPPPHKRSVIPVLALILSLCSLAVAGLALLSRARPQLVAGEREDVPSVPSFAEWGDPPDLDAQLATRLKKMEEDFWLYKATERRQPLTCDLNPKNPDTFSTLYTSCGMFFVCLKNVEPYLDGVRIHLQIGNPMMASYPGATLHVIYHSSSEDSTDLNLDFHEKDISITKDLESGRWTDISCVLTPVDPENFDSLTLSLRTSSVTLKNLL